MIMSDEDLKILRKSINFVKRYMKKKEKLNAKKMKIKKVVLKKLLKTWSGSIEYHSLNIK